MRALKYELGCPLPYTRYQQCREDREELKNTFCSVNDPVAREQYWLLKMKDKQPGEYRAVKRNEIFNVFDWSQLLPRLVPVPIKDYGVKTTLDTKTRRTTLDQFYSIIVLWGKKKIYNKFFIQTHIICAQNIVCLMFIYSIKITVCLKKIDDDTTNKNHWCRTDIGHDVAVAGYWNTLVWLSMVLKLTNGNSFKNICKGYSIISLRPAPSTLIMFMQNWRHVRVSVYVWP